MFDEGLPSGVVVLRDYNTGLSLIACSHDTTHRRDDICLFCKGDQQSTSAFTLPVKALAFAPKELTLL